MALPRALILTSTSYRHSYFVRQIASAFEVVGVLTEPKKNYFTEAKRESLLVENHFAALARTEKEFFSLSVNEPAPAIHAFDDLNSEAALERAHASGADVVCLFGTSILKDPWLSAFPGRIVNLHLGLSPFYRGSATLFWPFYYKELACLGTTIHLAIKEVDAGAILRRIKARFEVGDDYYRITNRLIKDSIDAFPAVVQDYLSGRVAPVAQEAVEGRLMKKKDFNESVLSEVLEYVGDGLSAQQLQHIMASPLCRCSQ